MADSCWRSRETSFCTSGLHLSAIFLGNTSTSSKPTSLIITRIHRFVSNRQEFTTVTRTSLDKKWARRNRRTASVSISLRRTRQFFLHQETPSRARPIALRWFACNRACRCAAGSTDRNAAQPTLQRCKWSDPALALSSGATLARSRSKLH